MGRFCFKVVRPNIPEVHLEELAHHFNEEDFKHFMKRIRIVFELKDNAKYHFTVRDNKGEEITIKNYWALHYLMYEYKTYDPDLRATVVMEDEPVVTKKDKNYSTESVNSSRSSVSDKLREREDTFSESLQTIMKHLEQGISSLQASVEKSTTSTVDAVVKTAAETAANVYRSMLPPPTLSEKPQFDVICDGCYTPIRGQRWRCETCDDFDLCSICKSRVNHNQAHNFRFIKNKSTPFVPPYQQPQPQYKEEEQEQVEMKAESSRSASSSHVVFICDYCDSDIVGIRHTCGACPDFDLCHSCFAIVKENHPEHIFVTRLVGTQANKSKYSRKNKKSKSIDSFPVSPRQSHDETHTILHRGVECDNCDVEITGTRYKCGHCTNYDLCETCEEYAINIHDNTHAFIKIRYPIQSLGKNPVLPKFLPLTSVPEQNSKELEVINATSSTISEKVLHSERNISPASSSPIIISPPVESDADTVHHEEKVETEEEILSATFVSDLNIPDGTLVVPNKSFIKMWKIVNDGNTDWPIGTHLLFNGGSILRPYPVTKPETFAVPVTSPNEEACISAELQAPDCPGEYSSYFCLCTPDGIRFGDSLWCTIKVDHDEEPESRSVTSAADILMNSSNSMIYPTISTAASSVHADGDGHHLTTPSNDGYTDHDDNYSEFTNDHISTVTSEITHHYSDSHMSSPTSSELDIGERNREMFFTTEEEEDDEEDNDDEESHYGEQVHNTYQVISPSASTALPTDSNSVKDVIVTEKEEDDDDFVIVDDEKEVISNGGSLSSSVQTITTKNNVEQTPQHDATRYRSELLQLHEMGFTSYDDLAISLLNLHEGNVDDVVEKLLLYP